MGRSAAVRAFFPSRFFHSAAVNLGAGDGGRACNSTVNAGAIQYAAGRVWTYIS